MMAFWSELPISNDQSAITTRFLWDVARPEAWSMPFPTLENISKSFSIKFRFSSRCFPHPVGDAP